MFVRIKLQILLIAGRIYDLLFREFKSVLVVQKFWAVFENKLSLIRLMFCYSTNCGSILFNSFFKSLQLFFNVYEHFPYYLKQYRTLLSFLLMLYLCKYVYNVCQNLDVLRDIIISTPCPGGGWVKH